MAEEVQIAGSGAVAKVRNPLGVVGLSIITLGIYFLFWWYYINREMHDLGQAHNTDLGQNPTNSVLAVFPGGLIIVPAIVTEWTTSGRIEKAQRTVGVQSASGPVIFLLLFLIGPVGVWYAQNELNKVWTAQGGGAGTPSTLPPAEAAPAAPFSGQPAPAQQPPPEAPPQSRRPRRRRSRALGHSRFSSALRPVLGHVLVDQGPLTDDQRAALEGGELHPFGTVGIELEWRAKDRYVLLIDGEGRLLASTGLLLVEVSVGGAEPFEVVGVGGVIVAPGHRGQGLGRTIVEAGLDRATRLGPAFALLFCRDSIAGLYRKLGFERVEPPVRVLQPMGSAVMPQDTMWRALREGAAWPAGRVLVRSQPF